MARVRPIAVDKRDSDGLTEVRAEDALDVIGVLQSEDLQVWVDGGWGVDVLVGRQTRPHEDLDIVVVLDELPFVQPVLASLGFELAENYLPTRAVLKSPDGRQTDLHPITFDGAGTGWQANAGPDGGHCRYPPDGFGSGTIDGRPVPCLTAALQVEHHQGYEPKEKDRVRNRVASAIPIVSQVHSP
jgi:lincosamide nucleotidyltransferase A/C/D/E